MLSTEIHEYCHFGKSVGIDAVAAAIVARSQENVDRFGSKRGSVDAALEFDGWKRADCIFAVSVRLEMWRLMYCQRLSLAAAQPLLAVALASLC